MATAKIIESSQDMVTGDIRRSDGNHAVSPSGVKERI